MSHWSDLVSCHMAEMEVRSASPADFQASWRQLSLGPIDLNLINSTCQRVRRTSQMASRESKETFELIYMQYGEMVVSTARGTNHFKTGDFALLRNAEPYELICPAGSMGLNVHFDVDWVRRWLPDSSSLDRQSAQHRRVWGAPLAALLKAINARGLDDLDIDRNMIADQIGSLMTLLAGERRPVMAHHNEAMFNRVRALLREHCADADLNPQALANLLGISKRTLHSLLARGGTTFSQQLISMRLERASRLLSEGSQRSVTEVAYAVGFNDTGHFSKRFRARFGCNPSTFRKR